MSITKRISKAKCREFGKRPFLRALKQAHEKHVDREVRGRAYDLWVMLEHPDAFHLETDWEDFEPMCKTLIGAKLMSKKQRQQLRDLGDGLN